MNRKLTMFFVLAALGFATVFIPQSEAQCIDISPLGPAWVKQKQELPLRKFFAEYKSALTSKQPTEQMGHSAENIAAQLDQEELKLIELLRWAKENKIQLDFIGQTHASTKPAFDVIEKSKFYYTVRKSQIATVNKLRLGKYQCVGMESHFIKQPLIRTLGDVHQWEKTVIKADPVFTARENIVMFRTQHWLLRYKAAGMKAPVLGVEHQPVHKLNGDIQLMLYPPALMVALPGVEVPELPTLSDEQYANLEQLFVLTFICRTKLAMMEMLSFLRENNLKRGALVFGAVHACDYDATAKEWGLRSAVINAMK